MKKILNFYKFNEAVIRPTFKVDVKSIIEPNKKYTIDELEGLFNDEGSLNTKFMLIDEFKSYLKTDKEIKGVPERPITPNLRFGVYLAEIDAIVVCLTKRIVSLSRQEISLIDEILRHESVHREQSERSKGSALAYSLERGPNDPKAYFSHYTELMAYARSYVDQCKENGQSKDDILKNLRGNMSKSRSWIPNALKGSEVEEKDIHRFKKYVYQYLEDDEKE